MIRTISIADILNLLDHIHTFTFLVLWKEKILNKFKDSGKMKAGATVLDIECRLTRGTTFSDIISFSLKTM